MNIRNIKTVELDSLKVPLRNLRRRSQEFLSGSKKSQSSKPAEKSAKATPPAQLPSQTQATASTAPPPQATASTAPQLPAAADMNGTASNGASVPSYLLTGKVAVVTGSGKLTGGEIGSEALIRARARNGRRNSKGIGSPWC